MDAAETVFARDGYEAAQVTKIAKSAGLSLTTLYRVLPSKWAVYRAVNQRRLTELMSAAHGVVQENASALQTVLRGVRMQLEFLMEHRDYTRIQLKDVAGWSTAGAQRTPEQAQGLAFGVRLYAQLFQKAIDAGELVAEDPELMARMVIASQQVRLGHWMERECEQSPESVVRGVLEQLLRSWVRPERLACVMAEVDL